MLIDDLLNPNMKTSNMYLQKHFLFSFAKIYDFYGFCNIKLFNSLKTLLLFQIIYNVIVYDRTMNHPVESQ